MRRTLVALIAFAGLLASIAGAFAGKRVALVVGNAAYANAEPLANPVNDAADMAAKLAALGFEVVDGRDLGKRELERLIGDFSDRLDGAEAALFFYAGHGLQVDGRNFVVPVDARLDVPAKLRLEAVPMDDILDIMEQQAAVSLVLLDACRNNPFTRSLSRAATTRSAAPVGAGLAQFSAGRGSFVAFSTAPGAVAMDGSGRNSPFTAALLKHIGAPGQSVSDLMIAVRRDVLAATRDFQTPWEQGSLTERFEFVPAGIATVAAPVETAAAPEPATAVRGGDAAAIETLIRDRYLKPEPARFGATLGEIYADNVVSFGMGMTLGELASAKAAWFAQWSAWTLEADAVDIRVDAGGETATAMFPLTYRYTPLAGGAATAGTAPVSLGLRRTPAGWRIEREQ